MLLINIVLGAQIRMFDPLPRDPHVVGHWVTVATNGSEGKGDLRLLPDGRFVQRFLRFGRRKAEVYQGTYGMGREGKALAARLGPEKMPLIVRFAIPFTEAAKHGWPKAEIDRRRTSGERSFVLQALSFDPSGPTLYDFVGVVYARKGQEARIKRIMDTARKRSVSPTLDSPHRPS